MLINTIFIHCADYNTNDYPRVVVDGEGGGLSFDLGFNENMHNKITIFLEEQDLINFKNSVISAVDNYKRGK